MKKILDTFEKNGFIKLRLFSKNDLQKLKFSLATLINNSYIRNKISFNHSYENLDNTINKGMINLERINHKYLSEIYDTMSKSVNFINLITNKKVLKLVRYLLNIDGDKNILINSTTIRMDLPGISKFSYGWHKDENTNIPGSNFVQLWAPLFNNVNKTNGALEVALKSHLEDVKTNKISSEKKKLGKINRSSYSDTKIINDKFKKKHIDLKVGEVLIFKKNLIHRSGIVKNYKLMRYACTCFYHDINKVDFNYLKIDQK